MAKKQIEKSERSVRRELLGFLIGIVGLMLLLGMLSYEPSQISCLDSASDWRSNWAGFFGAYMAYWIFIYWGFAGYILPYGMIGIGVKAVLRSEQKIYGKVLWFLLLLFCLSALVQMNAGVWNHLAVKYGIGGIPGGVFGNCLAGEQRSLLSLLGRVGSGVLFLILMGLSIVKLFRINLIHLFRLLWAKVIAFRDAVPEETSVVEKEKTPKKKEPKAKEPKKKKRPLREPKPVEAVEEPVEVAEQEELPAVDIRKILEEQQALADQRVDKKEAPVLKMPSQKEENAPEPGIEADSGDASDPFSGVDEGGHEDYRLPPLSLLDPSRPQGRGMSTSEVANTAEILQNALEEFGVEARVTGVQQGPVITCYEILPASGVRVERIKALSDNLALKMHAESIRIQAPIPGKGVCGVEVPNSTRASVFFRDMVESAAFQSEKYALPLLLGKDVSGRSVMYDLTKMPHLLIAGATGAGKSVCMNSILTGLLMKRTPDELRMILVDPKTVEFHAYNNLPHLVVPVITDAKKVALGLRWAIDEMERRFKWFNQVGARDLQSFNSRALQKQTELFGQDAVDEDVKKNTVPDRLPYIVIVIDELADLMHVAQAEIEAGIARLAAKSRAAGIHMILATQRPDVKVITGTIKANFPVRIAFKVSQKVDSRTILDRMGADTLLGKGDMLVLPPGTDKLIRLQGVYTSDDEINKVTEFCKDQGQPEFITDIQEKIETKNVELPDMDDGGDEAIVEQAMEVIRQTKRASTSSLQRRLRIGYTRAARVMDLLEERGIIGPPDGAGPREILIDLDGEIPSNQGVDDAG